MVCVGSLRSKHDPALKYISHMAAESDTQVTQSKRVAGHNAFGSGVVKTLSPSMPISDPPTSSNPKKFDYLGHEKTKTCSGLVWACPTAYVKPVLFGGPGPMGFWVAAAYVLMQEVFSNM